jgi:hypothetical protein
MPVRGSDADSRIFFDELVSLSASRLRATGAIKDEDRQAVIPFGAQNKLIGVAHTKFPSGGSWSYLICPRCGGRKKKLWLVDDAPRCLNCCWSLGVRYRSAYGLGRAERLRERERHVEELQAMLDGQVRRRKRLTNRIQRGRLVSRLAQFATQQQRVEPREPLPIMRAHQPRADVLEAIPNLDKLAWQTKTPESLERALDRIQAMLNLALEGDDVRKRIQAASLILRHSPAARKRGWI